MKNKFLNMLAWIIINGTNYLMGAIMISLIISGLFEGVHLLFTDPLTLLLSILFGVLMISGAFLAGYIGQKFNEMISKIREWAYNRFRVTEEIILTIEENKNEKTE